MFSYFPKKTETIRSLGRFLATAPTDLCQAGHHLHSSFLFSPAYGPRLQAKATGVILCPIAIKWEMMIFSNASKGCRLQGFVHVFSFTHKYTAINVYVHCILYLYVYTIITWKIFTTIFETVEHKNSLCCWSTPKKIGKNSGPSHMATSFELLESQRSAWSTAVRSTWWKSGFDRVDSEVVETFHGSTSSPANWHHPQLHRHGKDLAKFFVFRFRRLGRMSSEKTKPWKKYLTQKKKFM